jgi:hypothetical protein
VRVAQLFVFAFAIRNNTSKRINERCGFICSLYVLVNLGINIFAQQCQKRMRKEMSKHFCACLAKKQTKNFVFSDERKHPQARLNLYHFHFSKSSSVVDFTGGGAVAKLPNPAPNKRIMSVSVPAVGGSGVG